MKCAEFMAAGPPLLRPDMTIDAALGRLVVEKLAALPVVEAGGRYAGMFTARELLSHILPEAARLGGLAGDLGFMHESLDHARSGLRRIAGEPVSGHMEQGYPELGPDTEMMRALQLLYTGRNILPVVEPSSRRLLGLVTRLQALGVLMGSEHGW